MLKYDMQKSCHAPSIEQSDLNAMQSAVLSGWFTHGPLCDQFEKKIGKITNTLHNYFTTSGSSASLLAFSALTSHQLHNRILPGDEVITTALCFPTTIAPAIQYGAIPVFIDVDLDTCNATYESVKNAITSKTKAVILAHTLGNPFDAFAIADLCAEKGLWLIEDNCDALGSHFGEKPTGSFGDISICSFYPAHHITTGEGGMVSTNNPQLAELIRCMRDWGRDCKCKGGEDGICGNRFGHAYGLMPNDYDHKYVFSHFGYNLKNSEIAAALGLSQLKRFDQFKVQRRNNWYKYNSVLKDKFNYQHSLIDAEPSWFGYALDCGRHRKEIVQLLTDKDIQIRMMFAGNIIHQPCIANDTKIKYRTHEPLVNTDIIASQYIWLGVAPTVSQEQIRDTSEALILYRIGVKFSGESW